MASPSPTWAAALIFCMLLYRGNHASLYINVNSTLPFLLLWQGFASGSAPQRS